MLISRASWERSGDNAPMQLEVHKVEGGIRQVMYLYEEPIHETFSKRPYQLGQACDGTIDSCVHGLFIEWCRDQGHDPQELYHAAYPDTPPYSTGIQASLLNEARLQGTTFPQRWGEKEYDGLIASLSEINNHSLVDLVTEAQERGQSKQTAYERYGPQSPTPEREAGREVERDRL